MKKANRAATNSPGTPQQMPALSGIFSKELFDAHRLATRPRALEYLLAKNYEKAKACTGQIVIPGGMYRLAYSGADNRRADRKFLAVECLLQATGPKGALELTPEGSLFELEVEPRLAAMLDGLPPKVLTKSPAVLTLWIDSGGGLGLIRAEFLEGCKPRIKPGFAGGQADVDYYTLALSPEAPPKEGKALDEEKWQKVGRMNHFYLGWKHRVDGMRKMRQTMDMASLTNTMGNMYNSAMKGAAVDAAIQRGLQIGVGGR
jgi:hypothetical protein